MSRDPARPLVIVNADDLGLNDRVNHDIITLMETGRVSSATLLANGPAFASACEMAARVGCTDRLGVHLTLTDGPPLTDGMRPYCDANGWMTVVPSRMVAPTPLIRAIAGEFRAQVAMVVDHGIHPTHLDSHQHILNSLPFTRVAIGVARQFGIRGMRLTRNVFYRRSVAKVVFKGLVNGLLRVAGMRTTRWFTDVKPYVEHVLAGGAHLPGSIELMCHPGSTNLETADGHDANTALLSGDVYARFLEGVRLISYRDLGRVGR